MQAWLKHRSLELGARFLVCACFLAFAFLCSVDVLAYDPRLKVETLHTKRLRIHYQEGLKSRAERFALSGERALSFLIKALDFEPRLPIQVMLVDESDSANGSATVVPYNRVVLRNAAPASLGDLHHYTDWGELLFAHELAHVVHLDNAHGLPAFFNKIFGRVYVPNAWVPRWLTEGIATYFESKLSFAGRNRYAIFDAILRMAALDGKLLSLAEISGATWRWPQGSIPYLYGGHFIEYIVERFGLDALARFIESYGQQVLPLGMNRVAKNVFGYTWLEMYADFQAHLRSHYRAQMTSIASLGHQSGIRLSDRGQRLSAPRLDASDNIYFVDKKKFHQPWLMRMPLNAAWTKAQEEQGGKERAWQEPIKIRSTERDAQVAVAADGSVYWVRQEIYRAQRSFGDLFSGVHPAKPADGFGAIRMTVGARLRDPTVCGDKILAVAHTSDRHQLVAVDRKPPYRLRLVADLGAETTLFAPRCDALGQRVALGVHRQDGHESHRDLAWMRLQMTDGVLSREDLNILKPQGPFAGGPAWSPDGRWLVYHRPHKGVFDLFAIPMDESGQAGDERRLTRVLGAAVDPVFSHDGSRIVYRGYTPHGFDLFALAWDPDGLVKTPEMPSLALPMDEDPHQAHAAFLRDRDKILPVAIEHHSYTPWPTLYPQYWQPVLGTDATGTTLGIATGGRDVAEQHSYQAAAWVGLNSGFVGFDLSYSNRQFFPGAQASFVRRRRFSGVPGDIDLGVSGFKETEHRAQLSMQWPLFARRDLNIDLSLGYDLSFRSNGVSIAPDPFLDADANPISGRFASLFVGLSIFEIEADLGAISPERGFALRFFGTLEDPLLGSEYRSIRGSIQATGYFENPWFERHVLAATSLFAAGSSTYDTRRLFAVGGAPAVDVFRGLVLGEQSFSARMLRGAALRPQIGNYLWYQSAEYRFPIWDFQRGLWTFPAFLQTLHGAVFYDGAWIADSLSELAEHRFASVGAEVRLSLDWAYGLVSTLRLGFGHVVLGPPQQRVFLGVGGGF